uniref:Chitin-binding type-2 domain-containing protein n=1 Tax=Gongylonema pulchrum TaxID=637853 RepID=A0A183DJS5_9BILA
LRDDGTSATSGDFHEVQIAAADVNQQEACNTGEMIPKNNDCSSYYECVNGQYELRLCPSGYFFDPAVSLS